MKFNSLSIFSCVAALITLSNAIPMIGDDFAAALSKGAKYVSNQAETPKAVPKKVRFMEKVRFIDPETGHSVQHPLSNGRTHQVVSQHIQRDPYTVWLESLTKDEQASLQNLFGKNAIDGSPISTHGTLTNQGIAPNQNLRGKSMDHLKKLRGQFVDHTNGRRATTAISKNENPVRTKRPQLAYQRYRVRNDVWPGRNERFIAPKLSADVADPLPAQLKFLKEQRKLRQMSLDDFKTNILKDTSLDEGVIFTDKFNKILAESKNALLRNLDISGLSVTQKEILLGYAASQGNWKMVSSLSQQGIDTSFLEKTTKLMIRSID